MCFAVVEHFLNSRNERNANAMTELDEIESERLDLAQHLVAGSMSTGIPAGGKCNHRVIVTRRQRVGLRFREWRRRFSRTQFDRRGSISTPRIFRKGRRKSQSQCAEERAGARDCHQPSQSLGSELENVSDVQGKHYR